MPCTPAVTYDPAVTIPGELQRARDLAFAGDSDAAREVLVSLMPVVEQADRDDLMLEVFAQLGAIYLARSAFDGARECRRRIDETIAVYRSIRAGAMPEAAPQVTMTADEVDAMCERYHQRSLALDIGLAAAEGRHAEAAAGLAQLLHASASGDEHTRLVTAARMDCAVALGDDELHADAAPLWAAVIAALPETDSGGPEQQYLHVAAGLGYGRFCVETGRFSEAESRLRRAGARAQANGWHLEAARATLERAAGSWATGDVETTEQLVNEAYPVIAEYARAHDVARCWLYFGLAALATGALERADECWGHAERHWRELGKPVHVYRILLQRSWIPVFFGRYPEAESLLAQAREQLDSVPRSSWLQYARIDDQLGTVYRAKGLADLGFDAAGTPDDSWEELESRHVESLGIIDEEPGTPAHRRAMTALAQAAELKIPAALAVDSVRYSIADAERRMAWATSVAAHALAGAFAVAWEGENTALVAELIEYHSARGAFAETAPTENGAAGWASPVATVVAVPEEIDYALVAAGPPQPAQSFTRLGPLPPLQMDPGAKPLLDHYRELAHQRYGRVVTENTDAWPTWP